ncbi:uncharacterized protein AB675_4947 [Cyphellophora attinorum]|uniref:Uncharacterized protein n=1 Tax=Cyphellophora attinorum TaxID=1664694 RepID=A0A0N1H105_9EURO|nr:uncharacterized protein AB675_4947 [Phialophora attinorum]KPI34282.1 hypothetical protein AB675_4947 [Phialophora attinorum]
MNANQETNPLGAAYGPTNAPDINATALHTEQAPQRPDLPVEREVAAEKMHEPSEEKPLSIDDRSLALPPIDLKFTAGISTNREKEPLTIGIADTTTLKPVSHRKIDHGLNSNVVIGVIILQPFKPATSVDGCPQTYQPSPLNSYSIVYKSSTSASV